MRNIQPTGRSLRPARQAMVHVRPVPSITGIMKKTIQMPMLLMAAAFIAVAAPWAAWAGDDLLTAWQAAERHDPVFAAAREQLQAGHARQQQGSALLRPHVALTGSAAVISSDNDTTGAQFRAPGFGSSTDAEFRTKVNAGQSAGWALVAQQPLYNVERFASARQLDRQGRLAEAQFSAAQQDLILRTAHAYFAVLLAQDAIETLQAQREAAARARDVASGKFDEGAAPVTDRDEARARYDEISARELTARNELEMKRTEFADLSGLQADRLNRVKPDASFDRLAAGSLTEWSERASRQNPLVQMRELGQAVARDEIDKFRAFTSPSVDLIARIADDRLQGGNGFGSTSVTSSVRSIGVQLTIPIYEGGMRSAKREEAEALARKAGLDVTALRQEVVRQTRAAWLGVSTGITQIHAHEQALLSARSRLGATETGNEVGARTTLDLMNAQSDFYQAQRNLAQAKYQLLLNRLRLAATAGTLAEAELREVNAYLLPGAFAAAPSR